MIDAWHRLEKVIKWTGLSVNGFARELGLNRAENLYQIKKGNNGISRELAVLICNKYSQISRGWLLSGEGDMFVTMREGDLKHLPYYNTNIEKLVTKSAFGDPEDEMMIPQFKQNLFSANYQSDAMSPEIPKGSIVFCSKTEFSKIIFGEPYMVVGETFTGIRFIRNHEQENLLRLVAKNRDYDDVVIKKNTVITLYHIVGYLVIR